MIDRDWLTLKALAFSAGNGKSEPLTRVKLKLILSTMPKDEVCAASLTPAYTVEDDNDDPEIRFCVSNFGYLESYVAARALLTFVYPDSASKIFGKTENEMAEAYLNYLQDRLVRQRRGYCEFNSYLYVLVHENFSEDCVGIMPTISKEEQRSWTLRTFEGGYARFIAQHPGSDSAAAYERHRNMLYDQFIKWSYRSVILHELGHVLNEDLSGREAGDMELTADRAAFEMVGQSMRPGLPQIAMMHSLFFMARIVWATNGKFDDLVKRANEANNIYRSFVSHTPESVPSLTYTPFTNSLSRNGTVTYARHLHENFEYLNNPRSTRWVLGLPKSAASVFLLPGERAYPFQEGESVL
ncbi:hypothetical protein [Paraburkholderia sp. RL17-347-BIC-D]|uniref:hypothetical protein n=1 Tax=Paraburkholderia sp. RL17-347-BIC-D TaxID=3031632 RepID=UPI0038B7106D